MRVVFDYDRLKDNDKNYRKGIDIYVNTDSDDKIVSCLFASDVEVFAQDTTYFLQLESGFIDLSTGNPDAAERATQENRSLEFGVTGNNCGCPKLNSRQHARGNAAIDGIPTTLDYNGDEVGAVSGLPNYTDDINETLACKCFKITCGKGDQLINGDPLFAYGEHTSIDGIQCNFFTAHGASTFRGCGLSCYDASTGKFNPDNPGCSHCMTNTGENNYVGFACRDLKQWTAFDDSNVETISDNKLDIVQLTKAYQVIRTVGAGETFLCRECEFYAREDTQINKINNLITVHSKG